MHPFFALLIGLPLLLAGGHYLATGAGALALRLRIPQLTVGLTIVAMGTSAPELAVSLLAAMRGSSDIAMGNVVGSNIANLLLILGAVGVLRPLTLTSSIRWREIPFMLLSVIVLAALVNDALLTGSGGPDILSRGEGVALLGFFGIYLYYVVSVARSSGMQAQVEVPTLSLTKSSIMAVGGLAALVAGGKLTV
ncbi:MAG: sodium:calcium antiporter, partial [Oceanidesulfovibrio sp.]